jgi:hypothetical protein
MDEAREIDEIPWRKFATKPLVVEAVQIGIDVQPAQFEKPYDLEIGDYLVKNPEAGLEGQPDVYYRTKDEFNELYGEVQ